MRRAPLFVLVVLAMVLFFLAGACYTVSETEQVIITQFGKPVGAPIADPGLHFKMPIIQTVNRLEKRFLEWDGAPVGIPTKRQNLHPRRYVRAMADQGPAAIFSAPPRRTERPVAPRGYPRQSRRATPSPSTS